MSIELLAIGTGALASADFTVPAGGTVAVYLKDPAGPDISAAVRVYVQHKVGAEYFTIMLLTGQNMSALLSGGEAAMVYRLLRDTGSDAVGAGRG